MTTAAKPEVIVPFSEFREGKAGEIFAEVRREGTKIVIGDDDSAVCILMKPEDYMRISGDFYDIKTMSVAEDRWNHIDRSRIIPAEEVYKELGITDEDLEGWEDIELE